MQNLDLKKIINDNSIDSIISEELDEKKMSAILEAYLDIMKDMNNEYNKKTKLLTKNHDNEVFSVDKPIDKI